MLPASLQETEPLGDMPVENWSASTGGSWQTWRAGQWVVSVRFLAPQIKKTLFCWSRATQGPHGSTGPMEAHGDPEMKVWEMGG